MPLAVVTSAWLTLPLLPPCLCWSGSSAALSLRQSRFVGNQAQSGGGAVHVYAGRLQALGCSFEHNTVWRGHGGAISAGTGVS